MESSGELRDSRRTYTFYMDDALIDHFAPQIGIAALGVYALLARHAKQGRAFPAWTRIMTQLGIGRATVQRALLTLEKVGLITIQKRTSPRGDKATNVYILRDLSHLRSIGAVVGQAPLCQEATGVPGGGSVADHAPCLTFSAKNAASPDSMRGSVADYRGSVADYRGSVADHPLRSEGSSLKESQLKEKKSESAHARAPHTLPPLALCMQNGQDKTPESPPVPQPPPRRVLIPLPDAWTPSLAVRTWAQEQMPTIPLAVEADKFRDHARATGKVMTDWDAAFRNWLRQAVTYAQRQPQRQGKAPPRSKEEIYKNKCRMLIEIAMKNGEPINPKWEEALR